LIVNGAVVLAVSHSRKYFISNGGRFARLPHYFLSVVFAGLAFRLALATRD
jgi:hypothetical protein